MPTDKHGREIAMGDQVTVAAEVVNVYSTGVLECLVPGGGTFRISPEHCTRIEPDDYQPITKGRTCTETRLRRP
jgi:hypothetical protein